MAAVISGRSGYLQTADCSLVPSLVALLRSSRRVVSCACAIRSRIRRLRHGKFLSREQCMDHKHRDLDVLKQEAIRLGISSASLAIGVSLYTYLHLHTDAKSTGVGRSVNE